MAGSFNKIGTPIELFVTGARLEANIAQSNPVPCANAPALVEWKGERRLFYLVVRWRNLFKR